MNTLRTFWHLWSLTYYSIALRHLSARDPLHPDVPFLVHIINDLKGKTK